MGSCVREMEKHIPIVVSQSYAWKGHMIDRNVVNLPKHGCPSGLRSQT